MPYYPSAEIDVEEVLRQTGVFKLLRLGDPVRLSDIPSWDSPTGRRIYEQVVSTPRDTPLTRRQRRLLPATTMSGRHVAQDPDALALASVLMSRADPAGP